MNIGHYSKCTVYRLFIGPFCSQNSSRGNTALLFSLQQLCGVPAELWALLSLQEGQKKADCLLVTKEIVRSTVFTLAFFFVQQGQRKGRLTVGHYSNCAMYLLYFGDYCQCKMTRGRAECLLATMTNVCCNVCILGLTVCATVQQEKYTESWSLQKLSGVPPAFWVLHFVQGATGSAD